MAIKPIHRNKGLGSRILDQLVQLHPLKSDQSWKAFVDTNNPKAKLFFERNGWVSSEKPDADDMFTLELIVPNKLQKGAPPKDWSKHNLKSIVIS